MYSIWKKKAVKGIAAIVMAVMMAVTVVPAVQAQAATLGIDVSKYQGVIDWNAVKNSGVSFAFIKAGSAKSGVDPYFGMNMLGANAAGLRVGAYVYSYATSVEGAIAEANFMLAAVANYTVSFPIVFDIEDTIHRSMDAATLSAMSNAFCQVIEAAGYYPMVYSGRNFAQDKLGGVIYDKWIAQYADALVYNGAAAAWQFTSSGKVNGVNGNVDMNYLYKDYNSLIVPYGFQARNGAMYFYENYKIKKGWINYGDKIYFTDALGRMVTGWQNLDQAGMRYFGADGAMALGLSVVDGKTYYFDGNGYMLTGWQDLAGSRYLFAADGTMVTGWFNDGVHSYYFMPNGIMATALQTIGTDTYYFDAAGYMQSGFVNIGGANFYFNPADGKLQKNTFVTPDGVNRFYAMADGSMALGVQNIGGTVYFFGENGIMATNVVLDIGGVLYQFDAAGAGVPVPVDPALAAAAAADAAAQAAALNAEAQAAAQAAAAVQ